MKNILKREVRFDKNGVAVHRNVIAEKAEKKGLFSRPGSVPSVGGSQQAKEQQQRADLTSGLKKNLASEEIAMIAREDAAIAVARTPKRGDLLREEADDRNFNPKNYSGLVYALDDFSSDTLKMLDEAFSGSGKLTDFMLKVNFDDEESIKAAVTFRDSDLFSAPEYERVLQDVHWARGGVPLYDVLEDTDEHAEVSALISVAAGVRKRSDDWSCLGMSPDVAKVTADYQDRTDDIVQYISSRNLSAKDVDCNDLRRHLESR
jgi:hypothetical protein